MTTAADPQLRPLVTPEGVDLQVRVASASERGAALIIDLVIIVGTLIGVTLLVAAAGIGARGDGGSQVIAIVWLLGFFLLRNFYFTSFECSARAATPGKRIMGLRVAARNGSALRVDQVVARNTMRELELYLPIGFMLMQGSEIGAVMILCGIIWCFTFVLFPLFNRDRLRLGDVIAGTWVLKAPKQVLLPDLADRAAVLPGGYVFTDAQLDQYGVKELQVLESVLRNLDPQAVEAVAARIRIKIGWRRTPRELDSEFLHAYYTALRQRLEQRMLFGRRKADKHDRG